MKKSLVFLLSLIIIVTSSACTANDSEMDIENKIIVAVSVVPEAAFVEVVAGDLVNVVTVIPVGNSPANYQPTTLEMQAISDADIYFVMQVPTEEANILPKIYDFNEDILLVNLRDIVNIEYPLRQMDAHSHDEEDEEHEDNDEEEAIDHHIWLSPKRAIIMVQTIADELSKLDEVNAEIYQVNAQSYIEELNKLDAEIKNIIDGMENKSFMIYHGAYGYFAQDYGLDMISLEADGKAATAAKMQEVISQAVDAGITTIFYQDEFDDSQASTVAEEIGGIVMKTTPLDYDYIEGLLEFTRALSNTGE